MRLFFLYELYPYVISIHLFSRILHFIYEWYFKIGWATFMCFINATLYQQAKSQSPHWNCLFLSKNSNMSFLCFVGNLNNYFNFHVRLSIFPFVPFRSVRPCFWTLTSVSAVVSQYVTNKSCLVCVQSEKYASWVNLTHQLDCSCRGEAEVRILNFKTTRSEFHHLPRVGPKQLCALAHLGCTRAAGTS